MLPVLICLTLGHWSKNYDKLADKIKPIRLQINIGINREVALDQLINVYE